MKPTKPLLAALLVAAVALPVCAKKEKKADAAAPAAGTTAAASGTQPAAMIGSETISQAEVDLKAAPKLTQLRLQEYEVRKQTVEAMLQERLYKKEAESRGVSVEELLRTEVDAKITQPTQEDVAKFYQENQPRMQGRTLEQVGPQIQNFLASEKTTQRRQAFFQEIMTKNNAAVLLDPPRTQVAVRDEDRSKGPKTAPVTIVEYSDFQCPFCKKAQAVVDDMLKLYGDKVRLVYKDYPLPFHPQAIPAAEAAHCAGDQGKYWEYHANLMTADGSLQDDDLKKRAGEVGLDMAAFGACLEGTKHEPLIKAYTEEATALGVTGTPTFFVNGRMIVGARPDEFKTTIEDELARAARRSTGS